jgi:hypothetical protein
MTAQPFTATDELHRCRGHLETFGPTPLVEHVFGPQLSRIRFTVLAAADDSVGDLRRHAGDSPPDLATGATEEKFARHQPRL